MCVKRSVSHFLGVELVVITTESCESFTSNLWISCHKFVDVGAIAQSVENISSASAMVFCGVIVRAEKKKPRVCFSLAACCPLGCFSFFESVVEDLLVWTVLCDHVKMWIDGDFELFSDGGFPLGET